MSFLKVLVLLTFGALAALAASAQDFTASDLCDAGIGDVFGGFGRLGCKAVQQEEITADDVVGALGGRRIPPTGAPVARSVPYSARSMPVDPYSVAPASTVRPCELNPLSLDCEYQRILDDLEAEYGPLSAGSQY